MVSFLLHDISYSFLPVFGIYRKCAVPLGPFIPMRKMRICSQEFTTFGFQQLYEIGDSDFGRYVAEDMDVVRHPAYTPYFNSP